MRVSGIIRFDHLNSVGVTILQEFERNRPRGVGFTFGPAPDAALVRWDPSANFEQIYHMTGLLKMRDDN